MDIKIVKHPMYKETPKYAKEGDAGIDLMAVEIIYEDDNEIIYNTGIALELPPGYLDFVIPRSSIRKKDLILVNSVGLIDSGYRGEIQVTFLKHYRKDRSCDEDVNVYEVGERICQMVILPYPNINLIPVKKLSKSVRGTNGHGSTGN